MTIKKIEFKKLLFPETFESKYIPTLGLEVYPWNQYIIWDTAGQNNSLRDGYYINANLAIIIVNATSKKQC
uniref:Uncharacterized protein n=1 Tax=viral metagenome TaxID=1070528 RepID=A0A6C0ACY8_9ZZZZ